MSPDKRIYPHLCLNHCDLTARIDRPADFHDSTFSVSLIQLVHFTHTRHPGAYRSTLGSAMHGDIAAFLWSPIPPDTVFCIHDFQGVWRQDLAGANRGAIRAFYFWMSHTVSVMPGAFAESRYGPRILAKVFLDSPAYLVRLHIAAIICL